MGERSRSVIPTRCWNGASRRIPVGACRSHPSQCDTDGGKLLASLHRALAGGSRHPFPQRDPGMDLAPFSDQRSRGSLDRLDGLGVLDGLPGSPHRCRYALLLAETAVAVDPAASSAEPPADFALIGSPARPPKVRGIGSDWPKGRKRAPKSRYAVVKKMPNVAKTA
jgi:hypothetical protein